MRRTDRALRPSPFVMAVHDGADTRAAARLQVWRRRTQTGFFLLFLLAPALNLLRFDLADRQLWFLGLRWSLGLDALVRGELSATQAALSILWRAFIPGIMLVAAFLAVAYRFGRLYCGWLCPHFSVVEGLNKLLHRACGKFSLWDMSVTLRAGPPQRRWWPLFALSCGCMGFVWAITLLSYLVTPATVWGGLFSGTLSGNPARFLLVGTLLLSCEFAFARHLFCRFGCAVGLFQSLAWMANPRGMVVAFERERARDCRSCGSETGSLSPRGSACDSVCPMRLHPRNIKRMMFSCVQCGQCLKACEVTQVAQQRAPTLEWRIGEEALRETLRQRRDELKEPR